MQDNEAAENIPASPDERSFVDDDGTAYEWDSKARRFVEAGTATAAEAQAAAADASFDQADQTFSFEAEVIPAMPEPEPVRLGYWSHQPDSICHTNLDHGKASSARAAVHVRNNVVLGSTGVCLWQMVWTPLS